MDSNLENHTQEIDPFRAKLRFPQHRGHQTSGNQNTIMYRRGAANQFAAPLASRPPTRGAAAVVRQTVYYHYTRARTKRAHTRKETIIQKIENVENLSFQHFQQVFNNKLHKEIRQNDEHSTIQQVFNKVFNRQKDNK